MRETVRRQNKSREELSQLVPILIDMSAWGRLFGPDVPWKQDQIFYGEGVVKNSTSTIYHEIYNQTGERVGQDITGKRARTNGVPITQEELKTLTPINLGRAEWGKIFGPEIPWDSKQIFYGEDGTQTKTGIVYGNIFNQSGMRQGGNITGITVLK